jgi:hypothetical protein
MLRLICEAEGFAHQRNDKRNFFKKGGIMGVNINELPADVKVR